mmetsp:Transcript_78111/g.137626  ORF Transcript_78111/g.137626 Transcript_78111/m.137626 type:complete len:281 (+) Transcript_78111:92-934(+)|eukprot:CAMPEP_0197660036 /NCGR_PEP_ID=MMETSP1338-20131121/50164_1 /TAXON_ID=43686 ORGANISM="Pelagodinium beii, Strain RCC1491" /NCGR_SAMPLE_ID=MMETSP1338 /ASSEMBLY_ACC=CAM_ASM_000754 /LENGTH=280 /DNA_ID=CAMNT_0043237273 /DNA_START=90 /DNA_END=932 /DNA_ORIENTATION=+
MPIIKEDRYTGYDADQFRFEKMKGEVEAGMKDDWKRDKIDNAKKSAITTTASYDEFKSRVSGCMLKPIHRNEFNAPPKFAFNRQVEDKGYKADPLPTAVVSRVKSSSSAAGIRNSRELDREMRKRGTPQEKASLVVEHLDTAEKVQKIFGKELDAEVFTCLLEALDEAGPSIPAGTARRFLRDLTERCQSSAGQVVGFFTAKEHRLVARLLAKDKADPNDPEIVRVCASLGVVPSFLAEAVASLGDEDLERSHAADENVHADAAISGSGNQAPTLGNDMD